MDPTFTSGKVVLLTILGVALLISRLITALERRLVTGVAFLFAGFFLLSRPADDPASTLIGATSWAVGLAMFLHAGIQWNRAAASRAGPFAAIFLLPPAFFGAVLLGGLAVSLVSGPVRKLSQWISG